MDSEKTYGCRNATYKQYSVDDVPLSQERTVAASVLAEYDKNETYQSPSSYSIGQSGRTPQAVLSQEQMLVESSENSLIIRETISIS